MFRRARERGPVVLIPLAWGFVTAAHVDLVTDHTLFVAHVVMSVLLAGFVVTGRADMQEGTLRVWWWVIAVGLVVTLAGTAGFRLGSTPLLAVAVLGWMLLPAAGFLDTGRRAGTGGRIYLAGAGGCLVGALLYGGGLLAASTPLLLAGLIVVGLSQTAGILDAVRRN